MSNGVDVLKTVSATELRSDLTSSLNQVFYLGHNFLVEKNNEPMAVLVPFSDYQKFKGYKPTEQDTNNEQ